MANFISICESFLPTFQKILEETGEFESKGIFHSEMLMFCALCDHYGIEHIIESGRARAQSTEMIARFVSGRDNLEFDSIEYDAASPDVEIASRRMAALGKWANLHFGDSFKLIPDLVNDRKCILLVDGPKGPSALKLILETLLQREISGAFIHDVHKDARNIRPIIEKFFPESVFSDQPEFVRRFEFLDKECWSIQEKSEGCAGWRPYYRGKTKMKSYSATLGFIPFDEKVDQSKVEHCLRVVQEQERKDRSIFQRLINKIRRSIEL